MKLIGFFLLLQFIPFGLGIDEEIELKRRLMVDYDTTTIPKVIDSVPLNLQLGIAIRAFESIDQVDGTILSNIWLRYYWNDYRLRWNKTYWNVSKIIFESDPERENLVWTPDLYLYNTAENPLEHLKYSRIITYSNGDIIWSRPGMLKSTCKFNLTNYPFDVQNCILKFGSWVYHGLDLNLSVHKTGLDITNLQKNEEWILLNKSSSKNVKNYGCCPEPYYDITFSFKLERCSNHYTSNIIIPIIATSSLMVMSLIVPWDSGERISFVTTVMLSIIVFLLLLSENLPKSDSNPFLSRLTLGLTIFSLVSVFFTVIISSLYTHRRHKGLIYRILHLFKIERQSSCYDKNISVSSINPVASNVYLEDNLMEETDVDYDKIGQRNSEVDLDSVINSTEKKRESNELNVIPSIEKDGHHKVKDGELDCEETAGKVEALFTLIFFIAFITYLIYMFAIIS